ncbi:hypothetical protein PMAYCL1PPCAC_10163, partial [Pristionchus mayeri]
PRTTTSACSRRRTRRSTRRRRSPEWSARSRTRTRATHDSSPPRRRADGRKRRCLSSTRSSMLSISCSTRSTPLWTAPESLPDPSWPRPLSNRLRPLFFTVAVIPLISAPPPLCNSREPSLVIFQLF